MIENGGSSICPATTTRKSTWRINKLEVTTWEKHWLDNKNFSDRITKSTCCFTQTDTWCHECNLPPVVLRNKSQEHKEKCSPSVHWRKTIRAYQTWKNRKKISFFKKSWQNCIFSKRSIIVVPHVIRKLRLNKNGEVDIQFPSAKIRS